MTNDTPFLIELPQPFPGLERFIGAWVLPAPVPIVVDVGPKSSIQRLIDALKAQGLERIDYVFLSHIHIDHAGRDLAPFLAEFPQAGRLPCPGPETRGPRKIVEKAREFKNPKEMAQAYGPINLVPEDR